MWWIFQNVEVGRIIKYLFVFQHFSFPSAESSCLSWEKIEAYTFWVSDSWTCLSLYQSILLLLAAPEPFCNSLLWGIFFPISLSEIWSRALIACLIKHSSNLSVGFRGFVWLFQVKKMWSCLDSTAMASRSWKSVHQFFLNFNVKFMIHWLYDYLQ